MKNQLLKAILLCWAVMLGVVAFAQSNPGGVQGAGLWLRADRGVTYDQTTKKISLWLDQSSLRQRAYPMTQEIYQRDPIGGTYDTDPAVYAPEWANKQPAVFFDGYSSFLTDSIRNWKQIYIILGWGAKVGQSALAVWGNWTTNGDSHIFHMASSGDLQTRYWWWNTPMQSAYLMNEGSKTITVDSIVQNGLASPHMNVWTRHSDTTYSMNQQGWTTLEWMEPTWQRFPGLTTINASVGRFDGKLRLGVSRNKDRSVWDTSIMMNQGRGSYAMRGYIAEVIGFDRVLTPEEAQKIESYLAMKYGTKLASSPDKKVASNVATRDYMLSDGTVVWAENSDPSLSTYSNYVSFLVRDDESDLHLKASKPSAYVEKRSNGVQDAEFGTVTQATKPRVGEKFNTYNNYEVVHGPTFASPKSFAADKSFLALGRENKENMYSTVVRSINGECKVVWDLAYMAKCSAQDTFSMRFPLQPQLSKYLRSGAGVLMVDGANETFFPGTSVDTTLTINGITAINNAKYYVVLGIPSISLATTKLVITESQAATVTVSVPFTLSGTNIYEYSFDNKTYKYSSASNQFEVRAVMTADSIEFETLANGRRRLYVRLRSNHECLEGNLTMVDSVLFTKKSDSETAYPGGVKGSVFWLRADAGVTTDAQGVVTEWEDQSGTQQTVVWHNPSLTDKTYYARLVQNGFGGRPAVDFGAASYVKGTQSIHYRQIFAVQNFTGLEGQFMGFTRRDGKNHKKNCWLWSLSQSRNIGSEYGNTGGTGNSYPHFRLFSQGTGAENYSSPLLQMGITNPSPEALAHPVFGDSLLTNGTVQTTTWSTTGKFAAVNGAYPKFANTTFGWTKFDGVIYLGGLITTTNAYTPRYFGKLAEFIAFDRLLTEDECKRVESYLAFKYGLSLYRPNTYATYTNNGKDNIAYRDYVLSNGTKAWAGASDATLQPYVQYFNFLLNDTISKLNISKSTPEMVADQNWSTATSFVSYFDNNVTLVNGSNFAQPKELPIGGYAFMGANRGPSDSTSVFAAPDHNYIIWGRGYKIMTNLVDTVSIQVKPVPGLKPLLDNADKLSFIAEYPDFTVKFFKPTERAEGDTCYTFNGIDVVPHTKLYLAFSYAPDFIKCFRDTAFQVFEGLDSTAVFSENVPNGWFQPSRENIGYNEVFVTVDSVETMKLIKVNPPYEVGSTFTITYPVMKQNQTTRVVAKPINGGTSPEVYFSVNADTLDRISFHDTVAVKSEDLHCVIEAFNQLNLGENTVYVKTFTSETCVDYSIVGTDTINHNYGVDSVKLVVEEGVLPARPGGVPGIKLWLSAENAVYDGQGRMISWSDKSEANQTLTMRQVGIGATNGVRYDWANYNTVPQFNGYEAFQGSVPFAHRALYLVADWNGANHLDPGTVSTSTYSVNEAKFPATNYRDSLAYDPVYRAAYPLRRYNQERWLFNYSASYRLTHKDGLHDSSRGCDFFNGTAPAYTAYWGGVPTLNVLYTLTDTTMFPNWIMKTNGSQRGEIVNYLRTMYGYPIIGACATSASDAIAKGYSGRMAEVIATDRALTREENNKLEAYTIMKYGLSAYSDVTSDRQLILSDNHVAWDGNDYNKANMAMRDTLAWSYAYMLYLVRDDHSTLDVRKSRVVGNYNQTGHKVIAIANGVDFTTPEPLKRDLSYLIAGSPTQSKSSYPKIPYDNGINSYKTQVLKQKNKNDEIIFLDIWCKTYKTRSSGVDRISVEITPDQQYWLGQNKVKSLDKMGIVVNTETDTVFYPAISAGEVAYVNDIKVMKDMHLNIVLNATTKAIITPNTNLCLGDSLVLTAFTKDGAWSGRGVSKIARPGQVPYALFRAWEAGEGVHAVIYDDTKLNPTIPIDTIYVTVKAALSPNVSLTSTRDTFLIGTDRLPIVTLNTDISAPNSTYEFSINDSQFEMPLQAQSDLNSVEVLGDNLNVGLNRIYARFRPKMNCVLEQDTLIEVNRRLWKFETTSAKSDAYDKVSLYPSPNEGKFNVKNVPVGKYTYAITSANGVEVTGGSLEVLATDQVIPFDITSAPAGTYYLILANPKTNQPYKAKGFVKK